MNRRNSLARPQCENGLRGDLYVFSPIPQLVSPGIIMIPNPVPPGRLVDKQSCPSRATAPAPAAAASSSELPRAGVG